jgi:very-short-patch-repair endonuclease
MILIRRGSDSFDFYFNAHPETVKKAKELRKNMTKAEKVFWDRVRNRKFCGLKFRRQHPVEYYIADFYCPEKKLVIEIDGKIHDQIEIKERDKNRDAEIKKYDLKILRFKNEEILNNPSGVLNTIKTELHIPPL